MASSASSSHSNYAVFISFRGQDTRPNFTSHLYAALSRKHVSTFMDGKLPKGQEISSQLLKTIESSKVSIIIFSKDYAGSSWCLDELVKIMECKEAMGQMVVPIFYHVDPSDVRRQMGRFGEAFGKLKEKFKSSSDRVHKWTLNLTKAADLSGWDSNAYSNESELCEVIACHIERLCPTSFATPSGLFGINSIVKKIISDLCIGAPNVRCIGIWGIGGIGKTTIAELVFNEIFNQFDLHCFFPDVRKQYDDSGQVYVREQFYSKLGFDASDIQGFFIVPTKIPKKLSRKKVIVVLDDVSESYQLDGLGISEGWFGEGSRVIITSRDKQVFNSYADGIHLVEGLDRTNAVELFKMKAFCKMNPEEGHMMLIDRVVDYCKGLPLALKVLGSHLCQRAPKEWEIQLRKLEQNYPEPKVMDVLKISYDSLTPTEKAIFLDVACCFQGYEKDRVIHILDGCGFPSEHGLMRLEDKCLITIKHNKLKMHDLIEEMGRHIAQEQGSRLLNSKEIRHLLRDDRGNEAVQIICFNMKGIQKVQLHPETFLRLSNLRILIFHRQEQNVEFIVESDQSDDIPCLPTNLRVLHWPKYPFKSLPSKIFVENLVELTISRSNIKQLWQGDQGLENLKILNLSHCRQLIRLPNLSSAINLISIVLTNCQSLDEIDSWIQFLKNLTLLKLSRCNKLKRLPSLVELESLKTLSLSGCSSLKILPDIPIDIKELILDQSGVEEWTLSTCYLRNLSYFSMRHCKNITKLPSKLVLNFTALHGGSLHVLGCTNLENLPKIKGNVRQMDLGGTQVQKLPLLNGFSCLKELCLSGCLELLTLPHVDGLRSLKELDLSDCLKLGTLPPLDGLTSLNKLYLSGCSKLVTLPPLDGLRSLRELDLKGCSELVRLPSLHGLSNLWEVCLDGTDLVEIPNDIASISSLRILSLKNCNRLECLPKLPQNLKLLDVTNCTCLKKVESTSYSSVKSFYTFRYGNCVNLAEEERSKIMRDAHHFIKKLAIAFKTVEAHERRYWFSIPGSEIPEWVTYQSQEPSLTIAFPHNFFNTDNFLGFAFYVVVDFHHENLRSLNVSMRHNTNFGGCQHILHNELYCFNTVFQSDHVFVLYKAFYKDTNIERAFEFIPWVVKRSGVKVKVKKFGVIAIYEGEEGQAYCYNNRIPSDIPEQTKVNKKRHREEKDMVSVPSSTLCSMLHPFHEWRSFLSMTLTQDFPQQEGEGMENEPPGALGKDSPSPLQDDHLRKKAKF